jgi:DNA mismatch repair protein MutL
MPGRAAESTGFFTTLRYLGQLDLTYLVCEAAGEMVLVDQHAAHERVELARLREAGRDVSIQRMLFPVTIEASPAQVELVGTVADVLAQVGYEAEGFGKTTIAVKAVPAGIRHGDPAQLLRRLLDTWIDDNHASSACRLERVLAEIACHSVVRAGDRLSPSEAEALLRAMDDADFSTHGPHGRPVLLRLPLGEIARRFGR